VTKQPQLHGGQMRRILVRRALLALETSNSSRDACAFAGSVLDAAFHPDANGAAQCVLDQSCGQDRGQPNSGSGSRLLVNVHSVPPEVPFEEAFPGRALAGLNACNGLA